MSSDLLGELLLTQFVEGVELPAEDQVITKTSTGQFDPHDDGSIGHHHGDGAELNLQVLRQLLAASVPRVLEERGVTPKALKHCGCFIAGSASSLVGQEHR